MREQKGDDIIKSFTVFLTFLASCLFFVYIFTQFWSPVETGDIWWHLSTGRFISQNQHVPFFDPFPFAGEVTPWIFTQWLGSLFYYKIYVFFGLSGLQAFRAFYFLAVFAYLYFAGLKRTPLPLLIFILYVMSYGFAMRIHLRPYLFNVFFVFLFLSILFAHRDRGVRWPLFILPLVGILWINIHLGSLVYGAALICFFIGGYLNDFFKLRITDPDMQQERQALLTKAYCLSVVLCLYLVSFFCTPYGLPGVLYPFKVFLFPGHIRFYGLLAQTVSELQPPKYLLTTSGLWFYLLLFGFFSTWFFSNKRSVLDIILISFSGFIFLYGKRGSLFFTIVAGYLILYHVIHLRWDILNRLQIRIKKLQYVIYIILIVVFSCHIQTFAKENIYLDGQQHKKYSLTTDTLNPQHVLAFSRKHHISGKVYNSDRFGGYMIWGHYPQLRPYVDTRQVNLTSYQNHIYIREDPDELWPLTARLSSFDVVLLDGSLFVNTKIISYLLKDDNWRLNALNGTTFFFTHRSITEEKGLPEIDVAASPQPFDIINIQKHLLILDPRQRSMLVDWFNPPPFYIDDVEKGVTLYDLGYRQAGISYVYQGFRMFPRSYAKDILEMMLHKEAI
ncbi:MAG: hypothetical protein K8S27_10730 [Candidatus Omnitrophica bacterium]|nr:hypothetical protein [Candidatus Omnitrophota bacterium]